MENSNDITWNNREANPVKSVKSEKSAKTQTNKNREANPVKSVKSEKSAKTQTNKINVKQ